MSRREFSGKVMAQAALRADGRCEGCTRRLMTGDYHYEHVIPHAIGGSPNLDNCQVLCCSCHSVKTTIEDVPRIAKSKRNYRKARGIKNPSRFPCSRDSKWKMKIGGGVERR